jgi:hypothetical protein
VHGFADRLNPSQVSIPLILSTPSGKTAPSTQSPDGKKQTFASAFFGQTIAAHNNVLANIPLSKNFLAQDKTPVLVMTTP